MSRPFQNSSGLHNEFLPPSSHFPKLSCHLNIELQLVKNSPSSYLCRIDNFTKSTVEMPNYHCKICYKNSNSLLRESGIVLAEIFCFILFSQNFMCTQTKMIIVDEKKKVRLALQLKAIFFFLFFIIKSALQW